MLNFLIATRRAHFQLSWFQRRSNFFFFRPEFWKVPDSGTILIVFFLIDEADCRIFFCVHHSVIKSKLFSIFFSYFVSLVFLFLN